MSSLQQACADRLALLQSNGAVDLASHLTWALAQLASLHRPAESHANQQEHLQRQQQSSADSRTAVETTKNQIAAALADSERAALNEVVLAVVLQGFHAADDLEPAYARNSLNNKLLMEVVSHCPHLLWLPAQLAMLWPQAFVAAILQQSSRHTTAHGHLARILEVVAASNPGAAAEAVSSCVAHELCRGGADVAAVLATWLQLARLAPLTVQASAAAITTAVHTWWTQLTALVAERVGSDPGVFASQEPSPPMAVHTNAAAAEPAPATAMPQPPPLPQLWGEAGRPADASAQVPLLHWLKLLLLDFPADLVTPATLLLISMLKACDCTDEYIEASTQPAAAGTAATAGQAASATGTQQQSLLACVRSGAVSLLTFFADYLGSHTLPVLDVPPSTAVAGSEPLSKSQQTLSKSQQTSAMEIDCDLTGLAAASEQLQAAGEVVKQLSQHAAMLCALPDDSSESAAAAQDAMLSMLGLLGLCGPAGIAAQILTQLFERAVKGDETALWALQYLGSAFLAGDREIAVSSWATSAADQPAEHADSAMSTLSRLLVGCDRQPRDGDADGINSGGRSSGGGGSGGEALSGFQVVVAQALCLSWASIFRHVHSDQSSEAAFQLLSRLMELELPAEGSSDPLQPPVLSPLSRWACQARAHQLLGFLLNLIAQPLPAEAEAVGRCMLREERAAGLLRRMLCREPVLDQVVDALLSAGVMLALQQSANQQAPRRKLLAASLQAFVPPMGLTAEGRHVPTRLLNLDREGVLHSSLLEQNCQQQCRSFKTEQAVASSRDRGLEYFNPAIPFSACADLAATELRLLGLLRRIVMSHKDGPRAVAIDLQVRLADAFGAPPDRSLYASYLPRTPPFVWHAHVVEVMRLSPFLQGTIEACGRYGGPEAMAALTPVILTLLADCTARYGAEAQVKGALPSDRSDALWLLRVLKHMLWLPDILLATGELFHALPPQDISGLLLIAWHVIGMRLDAADGKAGPDQAASETPMQGRSGSFRNSLNGQGTQEQAANAAAAGIAREGNWGPIILPLLHRHIADVGPQYGRFVALLNEQQL